MGRGAVVERGCLWEFGGKEGEGRWKKSESGANGRERKEARRRLVCVTVCEEEESETDDN